MNQVLKYFLLVGVFSVYGAVSQVVDDTIIAPIKCGANQTYTGCGSGCGDLKCGQKPPMVCPLACFLGCKCSPGYVKDNNGNCILPIDCPCPPNEHIDPCIKPCENTCEKPTFSQVCRPACTKDTIPQCVCNDGFVRNSVGVCVLLRDCCPINEHRSYCERLCEPTCSDPVKNLNCKPICTFLPDCTCDTGFVRNAAGKCVRPSECEKCPGVNEVYQCGSTCGDLTCEHQSLAADLCKTGCINACYCKVGYVRNKDKICVLPKQCPQANACGPNMLYNSFGSEATCDNPSQQDVACTSQCIPGCYCVKGFVKNIFGVCIPIEKCSSADCKLNEKFMLSGSPCQPTCNDDPNIKILCVENRAGCFCKEGFVKDSNGNCILKINCPAKCKTNEIWKECGATGGSLTCSNYKKPPPTDKKCNQDCYCIDGYVKNLKGICILTRDCNA